MRRRAACRVLGFAEPREHDRARHREKEAGDGRGLQPGPRPVAETLPPAIIGVMFLGDRTRPGLGPAAIAGFMLAVASAVILARFGEAEHASRGSPRHAPESATAGVASGSAPAAEGS